jgi:hypothetical protein
MGPTTYTCPTLQHPGTYIQAETKVQGWVGAEPESLWLTFSKLSQADIDRVRQRLLEQAKQQKGQNPALPTESHQDETERTVN